MNTKLALSFLLASLMVAGAADSVTVSGKVGGSRLELPLDVQTNLVEISAKLLATCSNVVIQPKRSLESAKRDSHLDFVIIPPRKFVLGARATDVAVKEMVLTLPVSSGGASIESTQFRWYCSRFDTNISGKIDALLRAAHAP